MHETSLCAMHSMCMTTSHYFLLRINMYRLVTHTTYERLGRVTTIAYMKLSNTNAYPILYVCSLSSLVEEESLFVSWINVGSGVEIL